MKAYQLSAPSLDSLHRIDLPEPKPGVGQALVRLRAASLNFVDLAVAQGHYPVPGFPLVPVADGAGEVVEVGPEVTLVKPGDRVTVHPKSTWFGGGLTAQRAGQMRGVSLPGSLVEYSLVPQEALVPTPAALDDAAASTLPIAATTAWNALRAADIRAGSTVLLLGTGVVSIVALQLAKAVGARVLITSSSDSKLDFARTLGADEAINYRQHPAWEREVLERTGGVGANLVIESGGAETFGHSLQAAAYGGTVFVIGFLSGAQVPSFDLMPVIAKGLRLVGNNTGSVDDLRSAMRAIEAAAIEPVIDRVFDFDDARGAYDHLAKAGHVGKIVVRVGD